MVVAIPGYSLRMSSSILSPVQTMILGLGISASDEAGFESQRTVMAAITAAVSIIPCWAFFMSFTLCLTIGTQEWGIAEYAVILALHVVYRALLDANACWPIDKFIDQPGSANGCSKS